jgi:anti-sigma regulatory factor (Ser/Thr protein kinase)
MQAVQNAFQKAGSEDRDGEVLFDRALHEDSYEPLVDEHGKEISPSEVPIAPVDP